MAESARSEVYSDPDAALLVFENIHVVVAAADGAELCPRHVAQRGQLPGSAVRALSDLPGIVVVVVEKFVIDSLLILASQAEADGATTRRP